MRFAKMASCDGFESMLTLARVKKMPRLASKDSGEAPPGPHWDCRQDRAGPILQAGASEGDAVHGFRASAFHENTCAFVHRCACRIDIIDQQYGTDRRH